MQLPCFCPLLKEQLLEILFLPRCSTTDKPGRAGSKCPTHLKSTQTLAALFSSWNFILRAREKKDEEKMSTFHKNTIFWYNERARCRKNCGFTQERKKILQVQTTLRPSTPWGLPSSLGTHTDCN